MTESNYSAEMLIKVKQQKEKNSKRLAELQKQILANRKVPIPLPGDTRTALQLLTREKRIERFQSLANIDSLTGLSNKRFFKQLLPLELARVRRGKPLAVIAGDMQDLKRINDSFGHNVGDLAIQAVAVGMTKTVRDTDTAAHLSGDEFAALLPDISSQHEENRPGYATEKEASAAVALRICHAIQKQPLIVPEQSTPLHVQMDIGIAVADKQDTPETILKRADEAMYRMKRLNKQTDNSHRSSIVIATVEDGQSVFDRASFGEDGHSIVFERLLNGIVEKE
ncbi:MAG: diguanylate cyclase [Candidatus Gottesmanbacteria bacterium]|nr:diguanylate cyclase [Candidatus Gottesmanbacteria bacterium]